MSSLAPVSLAQSAKPREPDPSAAYDTTRRLQLCPGPTGRAASRPMLRLEEEASGRWAALSRRRCSIGSAPDNDLVLPDRYVSRRHASLVWRDGRLWLHDEQSRNGVWVNTLRVERCEVGLGTRIVVGHSSLRISGGHEPGRELGIVGRHPRIKRLIAQIQRLATTRMPVLVVGETGTGKELVARALHRCSGVQQGPLEIINCGAIPGELAEAELFGHRRGAFTGATRDHRGAFERASGGTLFLDEVGELPPALQPTLLRVLEQGVVRRVGDEQERPVRVRVVAATNRDLGRRAHRGQGFRLDLYHRLAVGVLQIPPLRRRRSDIPLLAEHFRRELGQSIAPDPLDPAVVQRLRRHHWPGNVRELSNAIQRACAEAEGGPLRPQHFDFLQQAALYTVPRAGDGYVQYVGRPFRETQREIYRGVVAHHEGNRAAAAEALGIAKSTFYDQLRKLELEQAEAEEDQP